MAKFEVNKGYSMLRRDVEAVKYVHEDGYFHFYGAGGAQVFSARAGDVITIERVDS